MPTTYRRKSYAKRKTAYTSKVRPYKKSYRATAKPRRTYRRKTGYKKTKTVSKSFQRAVKAAVDNLTAPVTMWQDNAVILQSAYTSPNTNLNMDQTWVLGQSSDLLSLAVNAGYSTAINATFRYTLRSMYQTLTLQNQSLSSADITLYKCVARRDVPDGLAPVGIMATAFYNSGLTSDSSPGSQDIGLTPFMAPAFCNYFKVLSSKQFTLPGGGSFNTKYGSNKHRIINNALISNYTSTNTSGMLGGISCFYVIFVRGQLTNDSTNTSFIGYTKPKIIMATRSVYTYTWDQTAIVPNGQIASSGYSTVSTPELITSMGQAKAADTNA